MMPRPQKRKRVMMRLALSLALLCSLAMPVHAIDGKKTAMAMAQQAAKAFEAGNMERAALAYLEAWHSDRTEPNYLYGAARAEQSAGLRERAEEHYRQFVALPKADPARVSKAQGYLTEFDGVRADEKVQAGDRAANRGEWRVAAAAYSEAWQLRPDRLPVLLKASRASKESGDNSQAEAWLRSYLGRAPSNAPDRAEAQAMLDALAGKPVTVAPMKPVVRINTIEPQPLPFKAPDPLALVATPTTPPTSNRRLAGWWTLGSGTALAVTGAALLILGSSAETQFNKDLQYDGSVVHGDLTYDQAVGRARWIGGLQTTGVTLVAVGVAAAGVGAALVWTSGDAKVAIVPDAHGFSLAGQF